MCTTDPRQRKCKNVSSCIVILPIYSVIFSTLGRTLQFLHGNYTFDQLVDSDDSRHLANKNETDRCGSSGLGSYFKYMSTCYFITEQAETSLRSVSFFFFLFFFHHRISQMALPTGNFSSSDGRIWV